MHPKGCLDSEAKCSEARGGIYYRTNSTTSKGSSSSENPSGRYNVYPLQAESNLGMWKNFDVGEFGFDTVEIGRPGDGDISPNSLQVIATVATKDFFIGTVGLSARQVSAMGSGTASGLLTSLNDERLIPSRSYGYTAGAAYRKNGIMLPLCTLIGNRKEQREPDLRRGRQLQVYRQRRRILSGKARDARVNRRTAIGGVDGPERELEDALRQTDSHASRFHRAAPLASD